MSKITKELADLAQMFIKMQFDLGLRDLNPTEAHVFLMIVREHEKNGNIVIVINI